MSVSNYRQQNSLGARFLKASGYLFSEFNSTYLYYIELVEKREPEVRTMSNVELVHV